MRGYPVALLLEGRTCLVVGGGPVAERKVGSLLHAGAAVRVVAPSVTEGLDALERGGEIEIERRGFATEDLEGAALVIVATDDPELSVTISEECGRRGLWVNVADQPELCSFILPAVVERGPLSVAVSTSGASPTLARHLRLMLEEVVGPEYGELAGLMASLRGEVKATIPLMSDRARAWRRVLASEALELLRKGEAQAARDEARRVLGLPR